MESGDAIDNEGKRVGFGRIDCKQKFFCRSDLSRPRFGGCEGHLAAELGNFVDPESWHSKIILPLQLSVNLNLSGELALSWDGGSRGMISSMSDTQVDMSIAVSAPARSLTDP